MSETWSDVVLWTRVLWLRCEFDGTACVCLEKRERGKREKEGKKEKEEVSKRQQQRQQRQQQQQQQIKRVPLELVHWMDLVTVEFSHVTRIVPRSKSRAAPTVRNGVDNRWQHF